MRQIQNILLITLIALVMLACGGGGVTNQQSPEQESADAKGLSSQTTEETIEALYFHGAKRCVTCNAIENLTKEVVKQIDNPKISFRVIDITKEQAMADKYEVAWSSLILVKNGTPLNLTEMGFKYAKGRPEEFKTLLKGELTKLLQ